MENQEALLLVVEAFETWRSQRQSLSEVIPADLRRQAVAISGQYKRSHIISALHISGAQYSKWQHEFKEVKCQTVEFIALPNEPLQARGKVRLHHPRGAQLEFEGISTLQLACVIRTFLEVS